MVNNSISPPGIYLPQNILPDTLAFETPPEVTRPEGFGLHTVHSFAMLPEDIGFRLQTELQNQLDPGNHLSAEEFASSPYARPGMNFPDGINENVAKLKAQEFDGQQEFDTISSQMKPGALSSIARGGGDILGAVLNPINTEGAALASEYLIGRSAAKILSALPETSAGAQIATKAIGGAAEGAVFSAPQTFADIDSQEQLGENPDIAGALASVGLNMGLGGVIRSFAGFKSPITPEADALAKQTAVAQLNTGKAVDVSPIVQQGAFEAAQRELPIENLETVNNAITDRMQQNQKDLEETQSQLKAYQQQNSDIQLNKLPPTAPELLNSVLNKKGKSIPDTNEIQNGLEALNKHPISMTPKDNSLVTDLLEGNEEKLLRARISQNTDELQDIQEQLQKSQEGNDEILNRQNELQESLKNANSRLADLQKIPDDLKAIKTKIGKIQIQQRMLDQLLQDNQATTLLNKDTFSPITTEQVRAVGQRVRSPQGDAFYREDEDKAFSGELEGIKDNSQYDFESDKADVDQLKKDDLLPEESLKLLEEVNKSDDWVSQMKTHLKNLADCFGGASE